MTKDKLLKALDTIRDLAEENPATDSDVEYILNRIEAEVTKAIKLVNSIE
jgi:hypothetical protein